MVFLWTTRGKPIHVKIVHKSDSVLQLTVENVDAPRERHTLLILELGTLFCFAVCVLLFRLNTLHALFVFPIATLVYLYNNVIKSESLVLVKDFAMQCSTTFASGTVRNALIPIEYVQDIVINEVLFNLKVIFVLQVLTKGHLFRKKPVITLLQASIDTLLIDFHYIMYNYILPMIQQLKPGLPCLKIIYQELHSLLELQDG
ncbi:LOW QUALITY PROTEIN: phosphatidylinositol N-acetylglucosaminyltransferase subunit H [Anopheles maculipalpis]|uniref:LOW QUALITY PROTEIN: phosphatidylinositol N-acetylglucosaminyltransferase subunit H n=1 Tax=Anopheles maculipalpis TaxID=1496333 RepID=UPI002159A418|nr:LOW QUALITY PROTEIN: phosphatidylinositol N-acetylglucosaminyltransferase subunit H [Anopheles maculipalpis]